LSHKAHEPTSAISWQASCAARRGLATTVSLDRGGLRAVFRPVLLLALVGCASPADHTREQRILTALSDDNWLWAKRDPDLVRLKLVKMQRGPYEWLRGTASLYWRDLMEPGVSRAAITFGDEASSRVLLIGDPHVENVGTYRASDGTMFVDWNDFDATGYGPYWGDLRRLASSFAVAAPTMGEPLARRALEAYAQTMAAIASGSPPGAVVEGRAPLFDDEIDTARTRGERLFAVDEVAPVMGGVRELALGDLEDVADDGVLEDRLITISTEHADWIDTAVAQWGHPELGAIKLRARRIGSGVSSYAAYRWNVVLEGATSATDDDRVIEIKETREGVIVRGVPRLGAAQWDSPGARSAATQRVLHARPDADAILGSALVGGLSLKIRDREAFQRGVDYPDLAELAEGNAAEQAQALALAAIYGEMLARAHGLAPTEDGALGAGTRGADVIAPLLANREAAFVDELATLALADAAQVVDDHALMMERDLFAALFEALP
jgi:uncharacterized protein (DUF2252 family)